MARRAREQEELVRVPETGPAPASQSATATIATSLIHATHPVTRLDVVFKPGELVPDWVPLEPPT